MSKYLDLNGLETVWGKVTDKITESKADWNQNDETADDYAKNRTHWVEEGNITIVDNYTMNFMNTGYGYYGTNITPTYIDYSYVDAYNHYLVYEGDICTVIWDGITYTCTPVMFESDGSIFISIGNPDIVEGLGSQNKEPFNITFISSELAQQYGVPPISAICSTLPSSMLITISRNGEIVYKLDNKFLNFSMDDVLNSTLNIQNGTSTGSLRQITSTEESSNYSMGVGAAAFGYNTTASGYQSHAEGYNTKASGQASHAEGISTTASNSYSHAEGYTTTASGQGSHAEGTNTTASGDYSHTEGSYTTASNHYSHAEGLATHATGTSAHAEGLNSLASSSYQHVQGKNNVEDASNKYAHIVGNGTDANNRSNAHTLDWDGNAWFKGNVYVGGTGQTDTAAAVLKPVAYNLLDNSDFRNPVNQRGATSLTAKMGYFIDRWENDSDAVTSSINSSGLLASGDNGIRQRLEYKHSGKTLTYAYKNANGAISCFTVVVSAPTDASRWLGVNHDNNMYGGVLQASDGTLFVYLHSTTIPIVWAALYEGAYTINNLPEYQPKGYAAEYMECRRYYQQLDGWALGNGYTTDGNDIILTINTGIQMRAVPTFVNSGELHIKIDGTDTVVNARNVFMGDRGNGAMVRISCGYITGNVTFHSGAAFYTTGTAALSADL